MHTFLAGMIVGMVILQAAVFAPVVFTRLDASMAREVIRALFPKFFVILTVLGLGSVVATLLLGGPTLTHYAIAGGSMVLPAICRALIPATNRARDEGQEGRFKRLHAVSVWLTMTILFANIAVVFIAAG